MSCRLSGSYQHVAVQKWCADGITRYGELSDEVRTDEGTAMCRSGELKCASNRSGFRATVYPQAM